MDLVKFVRSLPENWATGPIYAKGVPLPKTGHPACGKSPLNKAGTEPHRIVRPYAAARYIEQQPDVFKAIGVYTGPCSDGLVILDVDANLSILKKKWGTTFKDVPVVISPKKNAAKYLFRIPEKNWHEVRGLVLSQTNAGWEVLWGKQGVISGAYPKGGEYVFKGDINVIPEIPGWLLAEMQESFREHNEKIEGRTLKDFRYASRSREELIAIAKSCLSVIQPEGRGSEDTWWRIGAMLHSELPNEDGLNIWREWSLQDEEYREDWENDDPCLKRWEAGFKSNGGLSFGSLISYADHYDPKRARFQRDNLASVVAEIDQTPISFRDATLSFEEAMKQMGEAMKISNPGKRNFEANRIAQECKYRDQAKLEQVYADHIGFEQDEGSFTLDKLKGKITGREFLIPDVLAKPAVVLIYAEGGKGKSTAAWTLAKHVVNGTPFVVRGKHVPVQKGGCLILNGDQPLDDLDSQLDEVEFPRTSDVMIHNNWNLQYYAQFQALMTERKPKMVIVDSLIGCSGGRAFDENKSDFATPLYWLTRNNGVLFPATTILIIHHANKQGGFRGTTAIRDAVTETWRLSEPTDKQLESNDATTPHSRIISVEKSRSGRSGTALIMKQESDLTFSISDFTAEIDSTNTSPSGISDRVLARVRSIYPRSISRTELDSDPIVGGNVAAIRKSLQRWVKRGLIETSEGVLIKGKGGGVPRLYTAVIAQPSHTRVRGEGKKGVPLTPKPNTGADSAVGQAVGQPQKTEKVSHSSATSGTTSTKTAKCPTAKPSDTNESAPVGHLDQYPPARRSREDLHQLRLNANKIWGR